jgi:very-short-patch-repair endonuclease
MKPYRRDLKSLARSLRGNMTDSEQLLWKRLRRGQLHGMLFYRQKPLLDFIVDFYCPKAKLVVELDGAQHFEAIHIDKDRIRDEGLTSLGLTVLRFTNRQVLLEIEAVLAEIERVMTLSESWSK